MNYDKIKLCERIKEIRLDRRKLYREDSTKNEKYFCCTTQDAFADALSVDRRTVIKWEKGDGFPTLEKLLDICDLLDCNIEYFLGADELPYIDTISKASYFTKISPQIIKYGLEHPDYLDCLNYFMLPENCSALFNSITLSAWKEYQIKQNLEKIKEPILSIIKRTFDEYIAITPFANISLDAYKEYLIPFLKQDTINLSNEHFDDKLNVKECLSILAFREFKSITASNPNYDDFINFIVDNCYDPMLNNVYLEVGKDKLSKAFISKFSDYLSTI
jgi:transcriptional regulator with XRE-family HTH domain